MSVSLEFIQPGWLVIRSSCEKRRVELADWVRMAGDKACRNEHVTIELWQLKEINKKLHRIQHLGKISVSQSQLYQSLHRGFCALKPPLPPTPQNHVIIFISNYQTQTSFKQIEQTGATLQQLQLPMWTQTCQSAAAVQQHRHPVWWKNCSAVPVYVQTAGSQDLSEMLYWSNQGGT